MPGASEALVVQSHADTASLDKLDEILVTGEVDGPEVIDDPAEISRSIVAQLLSASSDEELQNFGNAVGWKEYLNVPMEIHGFRWQKSSFDEGAPIYFVVQATELESGERLTLTTGSMNVLAQLSNMARRGTLVGGVWMLTESENKTRGGFTPMWLTQPDATKKASSSKTKAAAK